MTSAVASYLEHARVEKRLAERTLVLYRIHLDMLAECAAKARLDLMAVQTYHVRGWVARMHAAGRSPSGIALVLSGWRGFYTWAGRQGLVSLNPCADVRAPKPGKPLPKALGVDDAVQLANFSRPDAPPWMEARDAAMVELLYGSGLRLAELLGLDVAASPLARGWLDLDGAEAHVLGKGSKRRSVPLGRPAVQAVQAWLPHRQMLSTEGEPALFVGQRGRRLSAQQVWSRLRARSIQAGLAAPVHPHMLRHSFASHVLQSSGDLRAVQELLGHTNITTTQVYTRLDFQHLAKTYDAAHPRAKR
ncbi:MAG: hypothetical protein RLZZ126_254 [Pseudomonadota bacterium]